MEKSIAIVFKIQMKRRCEDMELEYRDVFWIQSETG